jgi:uncharacterized protein (DUF1330 family)
MDQTKINVYTVEIGSSKAHRSGKASRLARNLTWDAVKGPLCKGRPVLEFKTREQARSYIVDNVYTDKVRIRHPDGHLEPASFRDMVGY